MEKSKECCGIDNCIHVKDRCKVCGICSTDHYGRFNGHKFVQREEDKSSSPDTTPKVVPQREEMEECKSACCGADIKTEVREDTGYTKDTFCSKCGKWCKVLPPQTENEGVIHIENNKKHICEKDEDGDCYICGESMLTEEVEDWNKKLEKISGRPIQNGMPYITLINAKVILREALSSNTERVKAVIEEARKLPPSSRNQVLDFIINNIK